MLHELGLRQGSLHWQHATPLALLSKRAFALPRQGGMPGAERIGASEPVRRLLAEQANSGRLVTAICAAPAVVRLRQSISGRNATSSTQSVEGRV